MSHKTRTTFYGLALSFALMGTVLGFVSAFVGAGFSKLNVYFGNITGGFAFMTWVWISVLLSYNNRPKSTHYLTRTYVHFYSFLSFVPIWLALAMMMFSQLPIQCDFVTYSDGLAAIWCGMTAAVASMAMIVCIFSAASAFVIFPLRKALCHDLYDTTSTAEGRWPEAVRRAPYTIEHTRSVYHEAQATGASLFKQPSAHWAGIDNAVRRHMLAQERVELASS